MNLAILLVPPVGSLFLLVFGTLYVAPTLLAIADAYGRPAHEWPKPRRRTVWLGILAVSFAGAIAGVAQLAAVVYALVVPRRVSSAEAGAGARAARRRVTDGFLTGVVVFGAVFLVALPNGSNDVAFSILGTSLILLVLGLVRLLFGGVAAPPNAGAQVAIVALFAGLAGLIVQYGTVVSCYGRSKWCENPHAWWIPAAHAASGALAGWWLTRRATRVPETA